MPVIPKQWLREFPDGPINEADLKEMFNILSSRLSDDEIRGIFMGTIFEEDLE